MNDIFRLDSNLKGEDLVSNSSLISLKKKIPAGSVYRDKVLQCVLSVCNEDIDAACTLISIIDNYIREKGDSSECNFESEADNSMSDWGKLTSSAEMPNDVQITIDSNEIGITVENVLERTVVHQVKDGSAASNHGVTAGALLIAVHDITTHGLSHYETVDALKRAPRPARLRFRPLPQALLLTMRDLMHKIVSQTPARITLIDNPTFCVDPDVSSSHLIQHIKAKMCFNSAPLTPREKVHEKNPIEAHDGSLVSDWAHEQLQFALLLYAASFAAPESSQDQWCDKDEPNTLSHRDSQYSIAVDLLDLSLESTRHSKSKVDKAFSKTSLAKLMHLIVFGIKTTDEHVPRGCHQRCLDWCCPQMRSLLIPLLNVACALLEADFELPFMHSFQGTSSMPESSAGEDLSPRVSFNTSSEPLLSDGVAAALLVLTVRAFALAYGDPFTSQMATQVTASLASSRCERARVASCRLALELYPRASAQERLLLRGVATRLLSQSQEPTLRAAAVTAVQRLGKVAAITDLDWLVLLCDTAASDADVIVRRGGFEFSLRILHRLPEIYPLCKITFSGQSDGDIDLHLLRCKIVAVVQRLVDDPVSSVRHAVAAHCTSLCTLLGGGRLGEQWTIWVVNTLHTFIRDDDVAVRTAAVDAIPFIFILLRGFAHRYVYHACFGPEDAPESAHESSDNKSCIPWSEVEAMVRQCCSKIGPSDVVVAMAMNSLRRSASMILPALLKLLHEAPDDLRFKIAGIAGEVLLELTQEFRLLGLSGQPEARGVKSVAAWKVFRNDLMQDLVGPLLIELMSDGHRLALANLLSQISRLPQAYMFDLEGDSTFRRRYFQTCLSDADSLGNNISRIYCQPVEIIPDVLLEKLVDIIEKQAKHRDWRFRVTSAHGVAVFAPYVSSGVIQKRLVQVSITLMGDKVNAVRMTSAEALCLTSLIESNEKVSISLESPLVCWNDGFVIPQLYSLTQGVASQERQLSIHMIHVLASFDAVNSDVVIGLLLPLLLNASHDVVCNIRLAVSKVLDFLMSRIKHGSRSPSRPSILFPVLSMHSELKKCLERLCEDEDSDVRFFSQRALLSLDLESS